MDKSNDERQPLATPNTTDDESLTTSTASDSWTIVTDKKHPKQTIPITYEEESHVEDLPKYEDLHLETSETTVKEEQEDEPSPDHHADTTSVTDEFSDEVSIISESENGDVLTPHPHLHELMQKLNAKFTTGEGLDFVTLLQQQQQQQQQQIEEEDHRLQEKQTTPPNTPTQLQQHSSNQIRQRKRRSLSVDETRQVTASVGSNSQSPYLMKRVYTWLFYFIVVLTSLGLYGKLFLNEWPLFSRNPDTNINTLEKKLIDMELQNNLMRAEIDLLAKQVNHLKITNQNQNRDKNEKRYQANKEKKQYLRDERNFNREPTWSTERNGQNHEYVEDAREFPNIEINNDLPKHIPSPIDSTTQIPNIEFPEEVPTTTENKQAPSQKFRDDDNNVLKERIKRKHSSKEKHDFAPNSDGKHKKRNESDEKFKRQNKKYNSKERFDHDADDYDDDDDDDDDSNERYHERNNSKERKYKRDDNENKRYNKHNSKEEYRGNENFKKFDSKEYQHQKRRNANSGERYDIDKHSGEWHEKLMQHREKSRNDLEERQKREKNWYLNRNDAREQVRIDEMHRT